MHSTRPVIAAFLVSLVAASPKTGSAESSTTTPLPRASEDDNDHWWGGFGHATVNGLNQPAHALTIYNGDLIAGGEFWYAGGVRANHVARWDGTKWYPLGGGLENDYNPGTGEAVVWDLAVFRGNLIAAGRINYVNGYIGGTTVNNIARWDGTLWHPMGSGVTGEHDYTWQLEVYNDNLIVTGLFTEIDGVPANYIARWDGNHWNALGAGLNGPCHGLTNYEGDLIASGTSARGGGGPRIGIMRWNGSEWTPIGDRSADVFTDVVVFHDTLIANFEYTVNGFFYRLVSGWNGTDWVPLGTGIAAWLGEVYEFAVYNDRLYAGGSIWGPARNLNNVARWNGTTFVPLGSGVTHDVLDGAVRDFVVQDGHLYVCGRFNTTGGKTSWYIGRWDDVMTPILVQDLAATPAGDAVEVTWRLSEEAIRGLRAVHVERADDPGGPYAERTAAPLPPESDMAFTDPDVFRERTYWYRLKLVASTGEEFTAGPVEVALAGDPAITFLYAPSDPGSDRPVTIRYRLGASVAEARLEIFSVTGRLVRILDQGSATVGDHLVSWDRRNDAGAPVARGAYFVRLATDRKSLTEKLVLSHR